MEVDPADLGGRRVAGGGSWEVVYIVPTYVPTYIVGTASGRECQSSHGIGNVPIREIIINALWMDAARVFGSIQAPFCMCNNPVHPALAGRQVVESIARRRQYGRPIMMFSLERPWPAGSMLSGRARLGSIDSSSASLVPVGR
jgi:hypothetical protein